MSADPTSNKRRRMSGTDSVDHDDDGEEKTVQTSKCKGATTIPIFLKKTYKMIDTCDPKIAAWTADGDMFVVKDPDLFASTIIPQYFDHNKFSSFARQLNFYGFRKMQSKPIRNSDFDSNTAKHVTFYNENFKKGRCDLLKKIQRSTRGGGNNSAQDQQREVQNLKDQVATLENKIAEMTQTFEERMRRLELDMLGRMEQMMLAMAQQQQTQLQLQHNSSIGASSAATGAFPSAAAAQLPPRGTSIGRAAGEGLEPLPFGARGSSINTLASVANNSLFGSVTGATAPAAAAAAAVGPRELSEGTNASKAPAAAAGGPTLPPHPKQKSLPPTLPPHPKQKNIPPTGLPPTGLPRAMSIPPSRLSSLARGLSRGISNLSRGVSVESNASAVLLRNSWEDKFFSMLMLGENDAAAAAAAQGAAGATAGGAGGMPFSATEMQNLLQANPAAAAALSARALSIGGPQMSRLTSELSAISTTGGVP